MSVFSDTCIVFGAIFGVISVYLTPYRIGSVSTHNKRKSMIKMEISKLLKADKWTIILPKEKISEALPDFCDARNQFTTINSNTSFESLEFNGIQDDCTEYKDIPDIFLSASKCKKKRKKKKRRKFYKGISCLGVPKDDKYLINLPRQSTLINSKSKKNSKCVILGEDTLNELETFAADSGYSVITIQNDNIEFSFKKSKSPINRLFHEVKRFLGLKKKNNKENNNFST
ncbi:PREDICTED: uncharacterized protein LOC105360533 [Ceratosolen solmsi marchali]|uniref:Uncharacterized protein LOC105360533 n=1 Tax=Ceratosolen solmsi marchali TaxID=326594 RepID=A0AAJ6VP80_9HYME|nr:PREDICTED: uncharacterized protein LOC105360533 [Ceratosolen solmsi marchali]